MIGGGPKIVRANLLSGRNCKFLTEVIKIFVETVVNLFFNSTSCVERSDVSLRMCSELQQTTASFTSLTKPAGDNALAQSADYTGPKQG